MEEGGADRRGAGWRRQEDRGLEGYPERSVAIVRAFRRPLQRALVFGAVVAVAIVLVLVALRIDERLPGTIGIVAIAFVSGFSGLAASILLVPRRMRRAFETYSWLGHDEVRRFRERTGGPVPVGKPAMDHWLATTPSTPAMRLPRIEMLAFVGRYDEARRELEAVPATDADLRFELAALRQYVDWLEHGAADLSAVREAAAGLPAGTVARQQADVTIALSEARIRLAHGDADWASSLEQQRAALGCAPWRATLLDTWRPLGGALLLVALVVTVADVVLRPML